MHRIACVLSEVGAALARQLVFHTRHDRIWASSVVFSGRFVFNRAVRPEAAVVDADGFRPNVGIVLVNERDQVLWARRVGGHDAWQFPQGGIQPRENSEDALFRELNEEVGLQASDVKIIGRTRGWLRYRLPARLRRHNSTPGFLGQKQQWFLLRMLADDSAVRFDMTPEPEFDHWQWVSYWYPVLEVVDFKREVYRRALRELMPQLIRLRRGTGT